MATLQIHVIEEHPSHRNDLEMMLREMEYQHISLFTDIPTAQAAIAQKQPDLVILNVFFDDKPTGLQLATKLKEQQIPVILVTSSNDRAVYDQAALNLPDAYLVRPFESLNLQSAIERTFIQRSNPVFLDQIVKKWHKQQLIKDYLFVRKNTSLVKLRIKEIEFIEADGNYCYLHHNDKRYAVRSSLRSLKELLFNSPFLQINRSSVLNFHKVTEVIFAESVIKTDKRSYTIGNAYRKEIEGWMNRI